MPGIHIMDISTLYTRLLRKCKMIWFGRAKRNTLDTKYQALFE